MDRNTYFETEINESNQSKLNPKQQALKYSALVCAVALAIEGIVCFSICSFDIRAYILSLYYIIFGILVFLVEVNLMPQIIKYLSFMNFRAGRGLFYIFLGTIALGGEVWSIIIACLWISVGIGNLIAICYGIDDEGQSRGSNHQHIDLEEETIPQRKNDKPPMVSVRDSGQIQINTSVSDVYKASQSVSNNVNSSTNPFDDVR